MPDRYFLSEEDIKHYNFMLARGYNAEVVTLEGQNYVVFEVMKKPYIGIAWPTVTGRLDGLVDGLQTILEFHTPLHQKVMPKVKNPNIKILLFPRYSNAS